MDIPFKAETKLDHCTLRRIDETLSFIEPLDMAGGKILDVGEPSDMLEAIKQKFPLTLYYSTQEGIDLNFGLIDKQSEYDTVLCFEVLEHIMNPLMLMKDIKHILSPTGVCYLSTPVLNRFGFMFNETEHFTEYRPDKLKILFEYAGFRVTKERIFRTIPAWQEYKRVKGVFRTTLRIFSTYTQLYRLEPIS